MKAVQSLVQRGHIFTARRAPIVETWTTRESVSQPVGDEEAARALELGQHDDHLSGRSRDVVNRMNLAKGGRRRHTCGVVGLRPQYTAAL